MHALKNHFLRYCNPNYGILNSPGFQITKVGREGDIVYSLLLKSNKNHSIIALCLLDCVSSFDAFNQTIEACLGDNLTFECSTKRATATVFQGDLLDCNVTSNEIVLLHSRFSNISATASGICNNGTVHGYSLPINDSEPCYTCTSQLHVTVSPDMIGKKLYVHMTTAQQQKKLGTI